MELYLVTGNLVPVSHRRLEYLQESSDGGWVARESRIGEWRIQELAEPRQGSCRGRAKIAEAHGPIRELPRRQVVLLEQDENPSVSRIGFDLAEGLPYGGGFAF